MLTGKYTVTNIPTREDVEKTKRRFLHSNLSSEPKPKIKVEGEEPGPWTVIATFPGSGSETRSFGE